MSVQSKFLAMAVRSVEERPAKPQKRGGSTTARMGS